jgi:hypothetical protein
VAGVRVGVECAVLNPSGQVPPPALKTVRSEVLGPPKMVTAAAPAADFPGGGCLIKSAPFSVVAECV